MLCTYGKSINHFINHYKCWNLSQTLGCRSGNYTCFAPMCSGPWVKTALMGYPDCPVSYWYRIIHIYPMLIAYISLLLMHIAYNRIFSMHIPVYSYCKLLNQIRQ